MHHDHDPLGLRADAPLLDAWIRAQEDIDSGRSHAFVIPGHKQRTDLVGDVIHGDLAMSGGLDTVRQRYGYLAEAERRAARLWGVDWCRFSVAGSTHGNQALALAVGEPGATVVVSRTLHRSLLLGLVLAGLHPVWVRPRIDQRSGMPTSVPVPALEAALADHPDACAVFLGDPSYVGGVGDIAGQAKAAHAAGIPLVVDAAWGAHLGFHPDLPAHPLDAGADAMVTSAHKALPAHSQAAFVLARTPAAARARGGIGIDPARLDRAFDATHTTSPSGAILASADAARALLARDGDRLWGPLVERVDAARRRLLAVPGLDVLAGHFPDGTLVEPTKLVVLFAGTGAHGHDVEDDLIAAGLPVELADRDTIIAMVTPADDDASLHRLTEAIAASVERHRGSARRPATAAAWTVEARTVIPPREAFFAAHESVPADRAVGRISAELVAPYPPGVPVLAPGELVTAPALESLVRTRDEGGRIAYAADPTLDTLQVVRE